MYAIISQTQQTIYEKKDERSLIQMQLNKMAEEMGAKVRKMHHLDSQIDALQKDLDQLDRPSNMNGCEQKAVMPAGSRDAGSCKVNTDDKQC